MDDLISEFISETSASLAALDRELGALRETPNDGVLLARLARVMHTIKGTCAFVALPRLEALAGAIEKRSSAHHTRDSIESLLAAVAQIGALVEAVATDGAEPAGDDAALLARMAGTTPQPAPLPEAAPAPHPRAAAPAPAPAPIADAPVSFARALDAAMHEDAAPGTQLVELPEPRSRMLSVAADMGAQLLHMAGALVDTRNQLLALMRRGGAGLEAPVRQLTHMINELQRQAGQGLVDTQSINRVLVMQAGGQQFAIAQADVRELVRIGEGSVYRVETVGDARLLRLRERLLPLMPLAEMLQMKTPRRATLAGYVAVMHVGGMDFGVVVDAVQDAEELVIRPLPELMGPLAMYRGAGLLGDGSIVLQLDSAAVGGVFGARGSAVRLSDGEEDPLIDYLMFHAGAGGLRAVPLAQVVRLESFDARAIVQKHGSYSIEYRGAPMALLLLPTMPLPRKGRVNAMVLRHEGAVFGLLVEHVAEIASAPAMKRLSAREPYYLGSAMLAGDAADVVDMDYLRARAEEMAHA